jgi:outer membrane protein assembly factor BamB
MHKVNKLFFCVYLTVLVTSCGLFKGNEPDPTPLEKIDQELVNLQVQWKKTIGITANNKYYGKMIPAIQNDFIYAASLKGKVTKLNAIDGSLIWNSTIVNDDSITGGIAIASDKLFVGSSQGKLYAIDTKTGNKIWNHEFTGSIINSPVTYNNNIAVQTENDNIHVLDTTNGLVIWSYSSTPDKLGLRGSSRPQVSVNDNILVACFSDGKIHVLNSNTGKLLWKFAIALPHGKTELQRVVSSISAPIITNNGIYAATYQGRITKFDNSGNIVWSEKASTYQDLTESFDAIYLVDDTSKIIAFNKKNGNVLWEQKQLLYRRLTSVVSINDYLIAGDEKGYLHVISQINGKIIGRTKLGGKLMSQPVYINDTIYAVASDKLYAIKALSSSSKY